MKPRRISGIVLEGHKGCAVEVPFDPAQVWGARPVAIRPGRRGFRIIVGAERQTFESWIVTRSRRHWLLLDAAQLEALGVVKGDSVTLNLSPAVVE